MTCIRTSPLDSPGSDRNASFLSGLLTYSFSTMHDNDPVTLETEKIRNLSGTQYKTSTPHKHAPGWNEHLASASEASVKADKDTGTASASDLQKTTVDYIQSRHSPDEATYLRDQVDGPLSSATTESDGSHQPQVLVRETVHKTKEVLKDGVSFGVLFYFFTLSQSFI
ncbi:hypothetical protein B0H19DRAFT_966396 [Mycena capillaripes]|nr:hypothetical protein B0H19DRAFT_966396 [Mycena capillaripes]